MLTTYQTALVNLLQTPSQPVPLISAAQQTVFINQARQYVAAEAECIAVYGSLTLVAAQRTYPFSSITFGSQTGVNAVNAVRTMWWSVPGATGQQWITPRPFEWFGTFHLNNPNPPSGYPTEWAQLGQGQLGTIFIDPLPDIPYVCPIELIAAPIPLVDDTTVEAIPPLWQNAVPFFAAWLAFMNLLRQADADAMLKNYDTMMNRSRVAATSAVLSQNYSQSPDMVRQNRLGISGGGQQQAGGA